MSPALQLAGAVATVIFVLGPVVGWLVLLNLRDRRAAALETRMMDLTPAHMGDQIAIHIRPHVFRPGGVVGVDMRACSPEEVWSAIARWNWGLPSNVRLVVDGKVGHGLPAVLTIAPTGRPLMASPTAGAGQRSAGGGSPPARLQATVACRAA